MDFNACTHVAPRGSHIAWLFALHLTWPRHVILTQQWLSITLSPPSNMITALQTKLIWLAQFMAPWLVLQCILSHG
jgi:hypothetical protein